MTAFVGYNIARGGVGRRWDKPKADYKIVIRSKTYVTITWKGLFTQSQVLLFSIVG